MVFGFVHSSWLVVCLLPFPAEARAWHLHERRCGGGGAGGTCPEEHQVAAAAAGRPGRSRFGAAARQQHHFGSRSRRRLSSDSDPGAARRYHSAVFLDGLDRSMQRVWYSHFQWATVIAFPALEAASISYRGPSITVRRVKLRYTYSRQERQMIALEEMLPIFWPRR